MRPLLHPAIEDVSVEAVLHALADPVRVAIYVDIIRSHAAQPCSAFLTVSDKEIPKSTLSQHFTVLREAGLIRSVRRGVEVQNSSRLEELEARFPGLVPAILSAHLVEQKCAAKTAARSRRARSGRG